MTNIANLLTEHMAIWTAADTEKKSGRGRASGNAGSVYGVKKLRELILELAVRGKLVPQDPNDEPASELLKRIQAEKAKLIAEGKQKKEKALLPIGEDEKPFELPQGWEWVRFSEFVLGIMSGGTPSKNNQDYWNGNIPWASVKDLNVEKYLEKTEDFITEAGLLAGSKLANKGDLIICTRMGLGKIAIATVDVAINQDLKSLKLTSFLSVDYFIKFYGTLKIAGTGMTVAGIRQEELLGYCVPLPPLAEQHRIVAKVDELMALCDQLEQQHSNAQEAHETLVSQLLATLTQSENAAEFHSNWQRIYAHFDLLFTTEASIDALKQTLLQLAVMGRLVPQYPSEEPASELLKRIQAEKTKLIAEGKLKKEKPLAPITEDEKPFETPLGWTWTKLTDTSFFQEGPGILAKDFRESGVPLIRIAGMHNDFVSLEGCNFLDEDMVKKKWAHFKIELGDIILSSSASLGKVAKVSNETVGSIVYTGLIRFRPYTCLNADYLILFLNSNEFVSQINKSKTGAAIMHFGPTHLKEMKVPLPPIAEQHRIVAKVDALMALCDQLKTRIQQSNQQQQTIADALVTQAIQPATAEIIDLAKYRKSMTCYLISAQHKSPTFGRTQAEKVLAFSQNHIGLDIDLQFRRKQAGPYSGWMEIFEAQAQENGWISVRSVQLDSRKYKYEYSVKPALNEQVSYFENNCPIEQRNELDRLLKLFEKLNTEEAEIIATLFCAWNDFVIDGITATDDQIILEVRENWHPAKTKFTPEKLKQWLGWLQDNNIIPAGKGCKTIYQQKLIQ